MSIVPDEILCWMLDFEEVYLSSKSRPREISDSLLEDPQRSRVGSSKAIIILPGGVHSIACIS